MSDRARVILVLGIVALAGGGAGFYFFKVYRPAQDLKNAQAEIGEWEARYQAARECLLGKTPGSSKTSEALAIREMAPDPWERGKCTPLISKLNRGEGTDTGVPAVESSWNDLDKAAQKAALAFARHVSESTTLQHDPLPQALDELDAARKKLRLAAKLPDGAGSGAPLAAAQTVPIGTEKTLTSLTIDTIPSAHGLILFGRAGDIQSQVVLTAGADPKVMTVGPGEMRSVPDMSWGAAVTQTNVLVGPIDAAGVVSTPTTLALPAPVLAAVAGTLDDGVVVYGNPTDFVIARAKNKVVTADPPTKITVAEAAIDVDGRTAIIWGTADKTQGQIFTPGTPDQPAAEVPSIGTPCLTKDRVWGLNNSIAISFGGGRPMFRQDLGEIFYADAHPSRPTDHPMVEFHGTEDIGLNRSQYMALQGCTPDAAVFRDRGQPTTMIICTDDCRKSRIPEGAPTYSTIAYAKGKVVAIASHGGVLGVWREGQKPTFYSLPEDARPVLAHEWYAMGLTDDKVIDVIARGEKTFVLIRIPAG